MGLTLIGVRENVLAQDYCTISTDGFAEPAGLEASNLKTQEPSEVARIATLDPKHTVWRFDLSSVEATFDGFALVNHNLLPGDYVRFTARSLTSSDFDEHQTAPNAIAASTNITGAVTDVDEAIDTPDGALIEPTTKTSDWTARFSWPNLTGIPLPGTARGQFVLRMIRKYTGAGAANPVVTYPKLTVDLYEAGVLKLSLGWRAVTSLDTTGQIFIFPFNPNLLTTATGADIECVVTCTPGISGVTGSLFFGQYAAMDTLSLYHESLTGAGGPLSSDWIQIPEPGGKEAPTKSIHYAASVPLDFVISGRVWVLSDGTVKNPKTRLVDGAVAKGIIKRDPQTYVEAGVWAGGPKFELSTGIQQDGPQINVEIEEVVGRTLGGQTYGADSFRFRVCEPTTIVVNREEKDFLLDYLAWQRGHSEAFYVILETGVSIARQVFTSFWATLKSLSTPRQISRWDPEDEVKYTMTIAFEEKL